MGLLSCRLMLTSVHWPKTLSVWASELDCGAVQCKKVAWFYQSCFLLHLVEGRVCVSLIWASDTGMYYGKKESQQRQCDAWNNILLRSLESWHLCECYFEMQHLPKHCCRPSTTLCAPCVNGTVAQHTLESLWWSWFLAYGFTKCGHIYVHTHTHTLTQFITQSWGTSIFYWPAKCTASLLGSINCAVSITLIFLPVM